MRGTHGLGGRRQLHGRQAVAAGVQVHEVARQQRQVVLYFYHRDDDPGCTVEALEFSDLALVVNKQYQGHYLPELIFQRASTILHWNAPLTDSLQLLETLA